MLTKILIADANEAFCLALRSQLGPSYEVHCCSDGQQALEFLRSNPTDLLVLDVMLPEIDGVTLLQQVRTDGITIPALATAYNFTGYLTNSLFRLGVEYAMLKPCALSALAARVEDMVHCDPAPLYLSHSDVSSVLMALGMPTHRKGYRYCQEALMLMLDNPNQQVTKTIYPVLGKRHGVEASSVEKNIRDAIGDAWRSGERRVWLRYFPTAPNGQIPRPTNTIFLTRLREALSVPSAIAR